MPLFSIILPTFNHCDPIIWAIKSIQRQTYQDFEILVMGDGVPERTREIMGEICAADARVKFFDNPKGEAKGEKYRHAGVMAAQGQYIAYIADDDVWHESHLDVLRMGLERSDFCNTFHGCVFPNGQLSIFPGDVGNRFCRKVLSSIRFNFFGPTCVGHSRESYMALPDGWTPAPKGLWTDLHMWRQWFRQEGVRFLTIPRLTTIHIDSPGRDDMASEKRAEESRKWLERINRKGEIFKLEWEALRRLSLNEGCFQFLVRALALGNEEQKSIILNSLLRH